MTDGTEVVKTRLVDVVPAEVHGFSVKVGLGPYPPEDPRPDRHGIYAELLPVSMRARAACLYMGKTRILASRELTPEGYLLLTSDPQGRDAELAAVGILAEAAKVAKQTV